MFPVLLFACRVTVGPSLLVVLSLPETMAGLCRHKQARRNDANVFKIT